MEIGIIGAGMVGRAIGKLAVASGHSVMLSNSRGPQTLFSLSRSIACQVGTADEAAAFGDLVVIAIPLAAYRSIPVETLAGKLVIDTNNYYVERDGNIPELDEGETTTSEMLARHLPRSRIVKAFNAIIMDDLENGGRLPGSSKRRGLPLAGDNSADKAVVAGLYDQFGFDPVDAGLLAEGWRLERGRSVYCVPMDAEHLKDELEKTIR
ncbi:NADPH-dependent F420 reductase [Agrobacterium sp. DSM 25558]|uniref:NADPH-dependent F420 reductase n=1 Tax=Agrobacterium sp. DSM 25558 TaxID=1907665 RepID=UPI00097254F1|nr:NAD(P)-binding domain-containing protein [Agrobacterium sp. DSM 25558]SCX29358.1 NADPH-dependent F420 reductase [Agrobacterium sp. DSM 25558]